MRQSGFGPFKRGLLFERFSKISPGAPFALFQKKQIVGDLAKIAITWPFGHFGNRCLRQNLVQSLHFKWMLITGQCHLSQCAFGPFKPGLNFWLFLKKFFWSSLCTFSENAGFG